MRQILKAKDTHQREQDRENIKITQQQTVALITHKTNNTPLPPKPKTVPLNIPAWDNKTNTRTTTTWQTWAGKYQDNATGNKTRFGVTYTLKEVQQLLENLPAFPPTPHPVEEPTTPVDSQLGILDPSWAVPTPQGWTYQAGKTLAHCRRQWQRQGAPAKALDIIDKGWTGRYTNNLEPAWFRPYQIQPEAQQAWEQGLDKMWRAGAAQPLSRDWIQRNGIPNCVLPYFLKDEEEKWRTILDARYPNTAQEPEWFKLPGVKDLAHMLQKQALWSKTDLKAGWWHIPYHPAQSNNFAFTHNNTVWLYKVGAFGDATLPDAFTYLAVTIARSLNARRVRHVKYLDDIGIDCNTTDLQAAQTTTDLARSRIMELGYVISAQKSPPPAKKGIFLGLHIDTTSLTITAPRDKLDKLQRWVTSNTDSSTAREIYTALGKIHSLALVCPHVMTYVTPLYRLATQQPNWDSPLHIPRHMLEGVTRALQLLATSQYTWGRPEPVAYTIIGDATQTRVAALLYEGQPAYATPTTQHFKVLDSAASNHIPQEMITIADKEAWTILWAMTLWLDTIQRNRLLVVTDNQAAKYTVQKGYSANQVLDQIARAFWDKADAYGISIADVQWLPSKLNYEADALSRSDNEWKWDWTLHEHYYHQCQRWMQDRGLPQPTVDGFASITNRRCEKYHSQWRDTNSSGNFFLEKLSQKELYWLNPPFDIITSVIRRVQQYGVAAYILTPVWRKRAWWNAIQVYRNRWSPKPQKQHPILFYPPTHFPQNTWPQWDIQVTYIPPTHTV